MLADSKSSSDYYADQSLGVKSQELIQKTVEWLKKEEKIEAPEAWMISSVVLLNLSTDLEKDDCIKSDVCWERVKKITRVELQKRKKLKNQNFGLPETMFNQMVRNLKEGDDELFERIFLKHFEDCVKFIVKQYKAEWTDAYDASMECLLEFHWRLKQGKIIYGNLRFLFTRMASQIYLKWIKKEGMTDQISGDFDLIEEPKQMDSELFQSLNYAWQGMCDQCQKLLSAFYYENVSLKEFAQTQNKLPATIRKQKQRCLEKLKGLFLNQTNQFKG